MPEIPECLQRRYRALEDIVGELKTDSQDPEKGVTNINDPSIRLMCDFWNILQEDPQCNLPEAVQNCFQSSGQINNCNARSFKNDVQCFMARAAPGNVNDATEHPCHDDRQHTSSHQAHDNRHSGRHHQNSSCCGGQRKSSTTRDLSDAPPLTKVLMDLKKAASVDNNCKVKMRELVTAEQNLKAEINRLEGREKEGLSLIKDADDMWSNMENAYKNKIAQSLARQAELATQLQQIEKSACKWNKNKKDLESQLTSISKCQDEITRKIIQKTNDLQSMNAEVEGYKKRIEETKKEIELLKDTLSSRKADSDMTMVKIGQEMKQINLDLTKELKIKKQKETEGEGYINEARQDLQKICKVLLRKKLEQEDLKAEKNALIGEINLLKDACDSCKERCKQKQLVVVKEAAKLDEEIQNYKYQCLQCNVCVDTTDVRKFCIDCPRCEKKRECLIMGDSCAVDAAEECVCQSIKEMFLNNVFENMYTVLEKQVQSENGQDLADDIFKCLKTSRNGKITEGTRRNLQHFILSTVKKNLNLTIVGGAVKTRCELDTNTYNQLMRCLKQVDEKPTPKSDKGTDVKKNPCRRWGGSKECNCPQGPDCICTKKAPTALKDNNPTPEPPEEEPEEKIMCPHKKEVPCGPDCGARMKSKLGADMGKYRPDPCSGPSCAYGSNMKTAQVIFEPSRPLPKKMIGSRPSNCYLGDENTCDCGSPSPNLCTCPKDIRTIPRSKLIEEVMGGFVDMTPNANVATVFETSNEKSIRSKNLQIYSKRDKRRKGKSGSSEDFKTLWVNNHVHDVARDYRNKQNENCDNLMCLSSGYICGVNLGNGSMKHTEMDKKLLNNDKTKIMIKNLISPDFTKLANINPKSLRKEEMQPNMVIVDMIDSAKSKSSEMMMPNTLKANWIKANNTKKQTRSSENICKHKKSIVCTNEKEITNKHAAATHSFRTKINAIGKKSSRVYVCLKKNKIDDIFNANTIQRKHLNMISNLLGNNKNLL